MNPHADVTVRSPSAAPGAGYPSSLVLLVPERYRPRMARSDHVRDLGGRERRYAVQLHGVLKAEGFTVRASE